MPSDNNPNVSSKSKAKKIGKQKQETLKMEQFKKRKAKNQAAYMQRLRTRLKEVEPNGQLTGQLTAKNEEQNDHKDDSFCRLEDQY